MKEFDTLKQLTILIGVDSAGKEKFLADVLHENRGDSEYYSLTTMDVYPSIKETPDPTLFSHLSIDLNKRNEGYLSREERIMLTWGVILTQIRPPKLLVLDLPEYGVHVAYMRTLASWIDSISYQCKVIVNTHSPDLLDYFTDKVDNVMVFSPNQEPCYLQRFKIEDHLDKGWELGDLYRVGEPRVGGWPW